MIENDENKESEQKTDVGKIVDDLLNDLSSLDSTKINYYIEADSQKISGNSNLGEILLLTTSISPEQLNEALDQQIAQADSKEKLGEILLKKKFVTEDELFTALSYQLNLPYYKEINIEKIDPEIIKRIPINFAKKFRLIPIAIDEDSVTVAVDNPLSFSSLDDLRILMEKEVKPVLAKQTDIIDAINKAYDKVQSSEQMMNNLDEGQLDQLDLDEQQDLIESDDEAPIIRLVNQLLYRAVKEKASDIHIDPFEKETSVRFRVDGVLYDVLKPPKKYLPSITSRLKVMAKLNIAEKRLPQDGRIKIKIAGKEIDIRISTLPTPHGERIVMRLLDKSNVLKRLDELGFSDHIYQKLNENIFKSHGILLVCGPTGSGKTTTLYGCLNEIYSPEKNILTVEDPVEYQMNGIGQIQVNPKINLTFANALRSILRQDPDIIMIGEIRDPETAEIAIQASLTGHFVFSTVHTNDSFGAVTRLVDMNIEPFLVASSLVGVLAQRLIRTLCSNCKKPYTPKEEELKILNLTMSDLSDGVLYKTVGCEECQGNGYKGRMGIHEFLPVDDEIRSVILKGGDSVSLRRAALNRGIKLLRDDGAIKVSKGFTTIEEILKVTQVDSVIE